MKRCNGILKPVLKASSQKATSKGPRVDIYSLEIGTLQMKSKGICYQVMIFLSQPEEISQLEEIA